MINDHTLQPGFFRLLRFEKTAADDGDGGPRCRIATHRLIDCPPYVALSYAWHEPQAVSSSLSAHDNHIKINGENTPVTSNLFYALRHLAAQLHDSAEDFFWVDALCIDQSSDEERTAQVSIMDQIYSQAALVCVWLGPDLEGEAYPVREFLRALLQKYVHESDWNESAWNGVSRARNYVEDFLDQNVEQDLLDAGLPALDSAIWGQVVRFWDRGWFSRVWVQQEVALAQQTIFWCGEVSFSQEELSESSRFFVMSGLSIALMSYHKLDPERHVVTGRRVGGSALRIPSLQALVQRGKVSETLDTWQAASRLTGPAEVFQENNNPFLRVLAVELFLTFRDDCSDPRDRVFALLVLLKRAAAAAGLGTLPLQVDYSKPVAAVFLEATAWIIEQSHWLGMLALIHPRRDLDDVTVLPSWVPDYCSPPPNPLLIFDPDMQDCVEDYFDIATDTTRPTIVGRELHISAKRIGTIADIGDTYEDYWDHGTFEATARLLLHIPEQIYPGYTRVDYWADTIDCKAFISHPQADNTRRSNVQHWIAFAILRRIGQEYAAGRIARGRELLDRMPSLERLAQSDSSRTVPTREDWVTEYSSSEKQRAVLNQRPRLKLDEFAGRRLFRLAGLGFPHCPAATVLGIGPEAIMPGDEVFEVVGSAMPLVLRRTGEDENVEATILPQARLMGEAFITGSDMMSERMEYQRSHRWKVI